MTSSSPRITWYALAATVVAAACSGAIRPPDRQRMSAKEIVERSKPAIVRIQHDNGVGTGFIVSAAGLIATNLHVVVGASEATVVLLDGREVPVLGVLAVDEARDLAVIRVDLANLPTLRLGDSDAVSAGDRVLAIGNPLGVLDYTVSDGLISSVRQIDDTTLLQISAPISEGSSGGPLFNMYGEVIGVATLFSTKGQNLNFGVPSNYLKPLVHAKLADETLEEFNRRRRALAEEPPSGEGARPKIKRDIPTHAVDYLDGCSDEDLVYVAKTLFEAIEKGAPIYNEGDHESCFRIYEGASLRLLRDVGDSCTGARDGLEAGLLRASTFETYTEKAWAMRDAFDGLIDVILRRAEAAGGGSSG